MRRGQVDVSVQARRAPVREAVVDDIVEGLRAWPKRLPCRLLYDAHGAELFERICTVAEYYPTRDELDLLSTHLPEIASVLGARGRVIEPGSGAGVKTRMLLTALESPAQYVPIDVSGEQLAATARDLRDAFPALDVRPLHGDYMQPLALPASLPGTRFTLAFFPGSTLGNFEPGEAREFLTRLRTMTGDRGALLLGTDSNQDGDSLVAAYDDTEGVTAAFDLNVLAHVNRIRTATFEPSSFVHRAVWDAVHHRVEMQLVSARAQHVTVADERFELAAGEPIVTEHCYKHTPAVIAAMLAGAGWHVVSVYVGRNERMRLWLAVAA
jgi:L-histidine Nalpha-methyltransferase